MKFISLLMLMYDTTKLAYMKNIVRGNGVLVMLHEECRAGNKDSIDVLYSILCVSFMQRTAKIE